MRIDSVIDSERTSTTELSPRTRRAVQLWLATVLAMIFAMVILGGLTRLTGSGLSMVEWRPLIGALPPLTQQEWDRVFGLYQASPQYRLVNHWMDLAAFKQIFYYEYFHRLLGRLIGVVFAVPWLWFLVRGRLTRRLALRTGLALVLGGLQGLMGWFMVMSGLVDVPAVSHMRLAAHLMLALLTGMWVLWILLDLRAEPASETSLAASPRQRRVAWGFVALVALQCIYGAFMAGTRAGWMFATFPDMHGELLPGAFMIRDSLVADLLYTPAVIHWVHRTLAWTVAGYAAFVWWSLRREPGLRGAAARAVLGLTLAQFGLGVATVVMVMPTPIAATHQACAVLLLGAAVTLSWTMGHPHAPRARRPA